MICNTCSSVGIEPLKIALPMPNDIQEIQEGGEKKAEIKKLYVQFGSSSITCKLLWGQRWTNDKVSEILGPYIEVHNHNFY